MKGRVLTSSHPSGGDWRTVRLAVPSHANLTAIACPSTHLCVIVDSRGGVFTSTTPANLVKANVACGSMSTCAAYTVDQFGNSVLYGYGQAIATAAPGPANPTDVACARTLCVVIDRRGGATVGS